MRSLFLALAGVCLASASTVSVTGTLCGGTRAVVTVVRSNVNGAQLSTTGAQSFTNGAYFATLTSGEDGSRYTATIQCASGTTTEYWLVPDVAGPLTTAQIKVGTAVTVGPYYWDATNNVWKSVAAGISASGGASLSVDNDTLITSGGLAGANLAKMETRSNNQSNADKICTGAGTASAQTCALAKTLSAYGTGGLILTFTPGTTNTTTQTLNVDTLGAKSILRHDGSALQAGDLTATLTYQLTYDGAAFRLPPAPSSGTQKYWSPFPLALASGGITAPASSQIIALRINVHTPTPITEVLIPRGGSNGTGACAYGVAIYSEDGATRHAVTNLTCASGGGGVQSGTFASVTLQPGRSYWLAWAGNETAASVFAGWAFPGGTVLVNNAASVTTKFLCAIPTGTQTYDASSLPATLTVGSCANPASFSIPTMVFVQD